MKLILLLLRDYWMWREKHYLLCVARCEENRRMTLKKLALCDAPKPYKPQWKWVKYLWETR